MGLITLLSAFMLAALLAGSYFVYRQRVYQDRLQKDRRAILLSRKSNAGAYVGIGQGRRGVIPFFLRPPEQGL